MCAKLRGHACFEAGVSQHVHVVSDTTKGRLKASPTEQAGGLSLQRGKQPGQPIVEKDCLSRDKGWRGQSHTPVRQAHLYLLSAITLPHYAVSPAASFGGNTLVCADTGAVPGLA